MHSWVIRRPQRCVWHAAAAAAACVRAWERSERRCQHQYCPRLRARGGSSDAAFDPPGAPGARSRADWRSGWRRPNSRGHGVCRMFGAQLSQKTTVLWGDDKKKAVKANPWVSPSVLWRGVFCMAAGSCDRAVRWSVAHARRRLVAVEVAPAGIGLADVPGCTGHPLGVVLLQEDQHLQPGQVNAPGAYNGTRTPRELSGHCRGGGLTPRAADILGTRWRARGNEKTRTSDVACLGAIHAAWHEARGSLYICASCHNPLRHAWEVGGAWRGSLDSKQDRTQVSEARVVEVTTGHATLFLLR